MANKRMFTKKITETDAFLDMPLSAQALYFHLSMNADDDGFLGSPKRIVRWIGANDDDLKLLIAKRFLLAFNDGVVVIKHWWMHNHIKSNIYTETNYIDERNSLFLKPNRSYSQSSGIKIEGNLSKMLADTKAKQKCGKSGAKVEQNCGKSEALDIDIDLDIDKELDKEVVVDAAPTIFTIYESTGRMLSPLDAERLAELENDYGSDWTAKAIERANDRGKVNIGYITGILRSWQQNGGIDDPQHKTSGTAQMLQDSYNMMAEWAAEDN